MIIEAADIEERITSILPQLDEMVAEGLHTPERVQVITHRGRAPR
jgi:PII-like signaling protein